MGIYDDDDDDDDTLFFFFFSSSEEYRHTLGNGGGLPKEEKRSVCLWNDTSASKAHESKRESKRQ